MPLTRIRQTAIGNDTITTAKLDDTSGGLTLPGVQYVRVPVGTDAQRPTGASGYLRFNTDAGVLEQWNTNTNAWAAVDSPPIITQVSYSSSNTATDPAGGETITLTGSNFQTGATVTIGGTSATSVTVVSTTSITFTTPAKTAGDYDVVVTNSNGLTATSTNGISYNGTPSFTTAAGNVGSIAEDVAMSTITIVAAEPDGGTLSYSITSGALPTGVSMSSAGAITGTPNINQTANTTFNFTVTATDDENQTNSRAFNLIVLRPIYATSIDNSLQFESSQTQYLHRTPSSAGNRRTWTWSAWVKQTEPAKNPSDQNTLFSAYTDNSNRLSFDFVDTDLNPISFYGAENGSQSVSIRANTASLDFSAWQHIMIAVDTTQATASDRVKIYNNGTQITDLSASSYPTQNAELHINASAEHLIGSAKWNSTAGYFYNGYMADIHFIDGQALTPTSFAEEFNGVWAPKAYSGTYGTNGFHLEFGDNQNIGDDTSGNTNDLTANNIGFWRVMNDSPTMNFNTLNYNRRYYDWVAQGQEVALTNGALTGTTPGAGASIDSTFGVQTGKWYWEVRADSGNFYQGPALGRSGKTGQLVKYRLGSNGTILEFASENHGNDNVGTTLASNLFTNATGDVHGVALDLDNLTLKWYVNGTLVHTETNIYDPKDDNDFYTAGYMTAAAGSATFNFGQNPTFSNQETAPGTDKTDENGRGRFLYDVPSGYLAMCSPNIAESTIDTTTDDRPEDYFNTVLYTGTGAAVDINTVGFQPDLVWGKKRSAPNQNHWLIDSVRGAGVWLASDGTGGEGTEPAGSSFDANGFNTNNNSLFTYTGGSYVMWSWKAGGAPTASNVATSGAMTANSVSVDGTLQSAYTPSGSPTLYPTKMSVNTKAGFSIVSWTGDGTAGRTLPHGLNEKPEFFMLRGRDARAWATYHEQYVNYPNTGNYYAQLNGGATQVDNAMFNSTAPTADVFTVGSYNVVTNVNYIGYFWHSVPGYSHMGEWKNVSETLGTYIYCGFKPAWIIIRESSSAGENWYIQDNKRSPYNYTTGAGKFLMPDIANAEGPHSASTAAVDFVANGFKIRTSNVSSGEISYTTRKYAFMAFAEDPFKYAEAR